MSTMYSWPKVETNIFICEIYKQKYLLNVVSIIECIPLK